VGPAENVNASAAENFDNQAAIVYEGLNDENDAKVWCKPMWATKSRS
jgi:hypothetical protein